MVKEELDFNPPINNGDVSDVITPFIDKGLIEANKREPRRRYLGASSLGEPCKRKLQYRYMQTEKDEGKDFNGKTLRIFQVGHNFEELGVAWLVQANFNVLTHDKQGRQFGFDTADGEVQGHVDGIITDGPVAWEYPFLWECKSANDKKFNEFKSKGVEVTNFVYYAQVVIYQAYMGLTSNPALFTVINKNTQEIYFEKVPFNAKVAQRVSDSAVNILKAVENNELMPRAAAKSDNFICRWCEFKNKCWDNKNDEGKKQTGLQPSWA
tara:strand:+ start:899 stop:1699 length:801 start_codon:yes stop_codon:yes gene_type:complete